MNQQLAALPNMGRKALQALWQQLFGKLPNPSLRREVLVPILAYRLQEVNCGGLKASVERRLLDLAPNGPSGRQNNSLHRPSLELTSSASGRGSCTKSPFCLMATNTTTALTAVFQKSRAPSPVPDGRAQPSSDFTGEQKSVRDDRSRSMRNLHAQVF